MIHLILPAVLRAFTSGNDLYLAGNYQGALAAYETAVRESAPSPELYYNMGNACIKLGDTAHAILYYEKSLALSPRDDDARANLKRATEGMPLTDEEKVAAAESFRPPLLARWVTLDEASFIFLSAYVPWALFLSMLLVTQGTWRRRFARLVLAFSLPAVILGVLLLGQWAYTLQRHGILLSPPGSQNVELREGPEGSAMSAGSSSGGLKARVLESVSTAGETWYKIEIPGGRMGWVKDVSLGLI